MSSLVEEHDQFAYHPKPKLRELPKPSMEWPPISISKLDDIALLIKSLTYGEMVTLATEINSFFEDGKEDIAEVLHKWSLAHGATRSATGLGTQIPAGDK